VSPAARRRASLQATAPAHRTKFRAFSSVRNLEIWQRQQFYRTLAVSVVVRSDKECIVSSVLFVQELVNRVMEPEAHQEVLRTVSPGKIRPKIRKAIILKRRPFPDEDDDDPIDADPMRF
jgi:hypothetical protein